MYKYEYTTAPPVEGFYWVLPDVGEEWVITWIDISTFDNILNDFPKAEFCGPIPKPRPRDAIKLGKGAMKINRAAPVKKV